MSSWEEKSLPSLLLPDAQAGQLQLSHAARSPARRAQVGGLLPPPSSDVAHDLCHVAPKSSPSRRLLPDLCPGIHARGMSQGGARNDQSVCPARKWPAHGSAQVVDPAPCSLCESSVAQVQSKGSSSRLGPTGTSVGKGDGRRRARTACPHDVALRVSLTGHCGVVGESTTCCTR